MEKRHDQLLITRLEDAIYNGCSHITWEELYLWYGVTRIAAGTYRDLSERMKELSPSDSVKPRLIEGRGGIFVFDGTKTRAIDPDVAK